MKNNIQEVKKSQKAIQGFVRSLRKHHASQITDVFLYGSQARGDQQDLSDIDILIIAHTNDWHFKHEISNLAADVSLEFDILLDPHVISKENWQEMGKANFSFYKNVISDGIAFIPSS